MPSLRRTRKQNSFDNTATFRVAIFGHSGVGKTAFNVRFVTKRFIGEYDSASSENIYQRTLLLSHDHSVCFELMDTSGKEEEKCKLKKKIKWADAFVLLYSTTDQVSFSEIIQLKFLVSHIIKQGSQKRTREPLIAIVGNKKDLEAERMVSTGEGAKLARELGCSFHEVSVRESVDEVNKVFEDLYKSWLRSEKMAPPKSGKSSPHIDIPKMQQHFHSLQSKCRAKSFKHIDRMPRMQGSLNNGPCAAFSRSQEWPTLERGQSAFRTHGTSSLCSSPVLKSRFVHVDPLSCDVEASRQARNEESFSQTSSDSDTERHCAVINTKSLRPPIVAQTSISDGGETSSLENFSSDSSGSDGVFDAREAAEAFLKKTMVLTLE